MSDWRYIYGEIDEKIHTNGIKAISGDVLNEVLTKMIEAVDGNLPTAGNGLNDIAGTFSRQLSIDGKYSSFYNENAGENEYTRMCLLRHHDFAKYNNIIIAVGFSRNVDRKSDVIFVNVGGATPTINTLTTSNTFFLETTVDGNAYLCLKKETNIDTQINGAFSILMASTNTGEAMDSGHLNNFEFYTVEIPATGTIIAPVRISEPPLPATPENPETKFLNGNREWVEASGTEYTAGKNITITNGEIDTKRVLELTAITIADGSPAIRIITTADGKQAVEEGKGNSASGPYSHAEGNGTVASGSSSHAEGSWVQASGPYSHAEGYGTVASGSSSHAEGNGTVARGDFSHAEGKYNIEDATGAKLFIVGNGSSAARHNAFSVNADNSITIGDTTITEAQLIALLATL